MSPLPEPPPHPLKLDNFQERYTRALFLSNLCSDYANSVQLLVDHVIARKDPYRGGGGEALLAITAAREVVRTATAVMKTSAMDEYFASDIRKKLNEFQAKHPHLKQARDVIAHADEYIASKGNDRIQWFDTTNNFEDNSWVYRIGNKLDVDMTQLATDSNALALTVQQVTALCIHIESKLEVPGLIIKKLMEHGIYATLSASGEVGELTIHKTEPRDG